MNNSPDNSLDNSPENSLEDTPNEPVRQHEPGRQPTGSPELGGSRAPALAVVTGGGTAGHVLPALAVADALVARGVAAEQVFYVGCQRGIETTLVPTTPYRHEFYDVTGVQRSFTRRNLSVVPKMVAATRRATGLLRELHPRVVVSVGGYASMPAVFAARRLRIPIVVVSFDHRPGRASQLAARFAAASAVAFADSPLPRATLTGAPIRQRILDVDRRAQRRDARKVLGVPDERFLIAVMGGSQGSAALNSAIGDYVDAHRADGGLAIRHVVGDRFVDQAGPRLHDPEGLLYEPIGYEPDMAAVYAASDVLVGRGGASTVHEVAATGTPAILVPWPGAAEDHQTGNVKWLADSGGAILLPEGSIAQLGRTLDELRGDDDRRDSLGEQAFRLGSNTRSGALAELVLDIAGRGTSAERGQPG